MKHVHILGICGTFMAGLALLAKQQGYKVSGSDQHIYPPMSTLLQENEITVLQGYDAAHLQPTPDFIVIGNALSRGNPEVEEVLNKNLKYYSGPEWLAQFILPQRWVLAVAGTHGKTTTSSILAWILEKAGLEPGFLIGGVAKNFNCSARLGKSRYFVIEADEYDTAFFDKRSKFILYHPKTAILNNLEYDHADIFPDLAAIQQQFHYFVRTIPGNGCIIHEADDENLNHVLQKGCWTRQETFSLTQGDWVAKNIAADGHQFDVYYKNRNVGQVSWSLLGLHNVKNALAAVAAAHHVEVSPSLAIGALNSFEGVKRRLEIRGVINDITVYDDFAHHPTAIATTLSGLRNRIGDARLIAIVEFASNTMGLGTHQQHIVSSMIDADQIIFLKPKQWDIFPLVNQFSQPVEVFNSVDEIVAKTVSIAKSGDHLLIMSNKSFDGIHEKLLLGLREKLSEL